MKNIEKSVVHMLAVAAAECPDRLAVRCASAALSYGQYFNCVASLAARLREAGVAPGDRVVTIMANSADAAVANFGIQASGAQLVPLNPAYTSAELDIIIADASPTVVLCDVEIAATLEKAGAGCEMRITVSPGDLLLDRDNASERDEIVLPEPEWLSTLQYTGGTQGLPKGVNLTHRSVVSNIAQREALVPTVDGERVMCITPLFHVYAVSMGLYLAAHCGRNFPRYRVPSHLVPLCEPDDPAGIHETPGFCRRRLFVAQDLLVRVGPAFGGNLAKVGRSHRLPGLRRLWPD